MSLLGLNFSNRYAEQLGLDPDEVLRGILNELRVRRLRMSLYWDEIQPEPTRYDFAAVHRFLDLAEARGARVLLTVGLKAQRRPGFYPPAWMIRSNAEAQQGPATSPRLIAHLLLMLERAVALLADYTTIEGWEVESAPFSEAGTDARGWAFDGATVQKEITAIAGSDPRHRPLVITAGAGAPFDLSWLRAMRLADVLGQILPEGPRSWHSRRSVLEKLAFGRLQPSLLIRALLAHRCGRQYWITELQAEPDEGDDAHVKFDGADGVLERILPDLARATRLRPDRIYLKGAEWWWRQRRHGDDRYWAQARDLFDQQ